MTFDLGDRAFTKIFERRTFAAGDVIFQQGQAARELYIVLRGEVEIVSKGKGGTEIPLTTVKTGQIFGELSFLAESGRTAAAISAKGCELLVLNHEVLKRKLEEAD